MCNAMNKFEKFFIEINEKESILYLMKIIHKMRILCDICNYITKLRSYKQTIDGLVFATH